MITAPKKYRLSSKAYREMIKTGILSENDRVELINGEIIEMTAIGSRHAACVNKLNRLFGQKLQQKNVIVSIQNPVFLGDGNEPEPDVALLQFEEDFYSNSPPQVEDIMLLVEVADSSLDYDKNVKLPIYAQAGSKEVWIVDLNNNFLLCYRKPKNGKFLEFNKYNFQDTVVLKSFNNLELRVADIIPPAI